MRECGARDMLLLLYAKFGTKPNRPRRRTMGSFCDGDFNLLQNHFSVKFDWQIIETFGAYGSVNLLIFRSQNALFYNIISITYNYKNINA
jgi:hypothetical protein